MLNVQQPIFHPILTSTCFYLTKGCSKYQGNIKVKWKQINFLSILNASEIYVLCGWYAFHEKTFLFLSVITNIMCM